ncbi:MAG: hypothetical protein RMX68_020570 [Aulosira sp. ZfuVER01]|nr:hypothetical protein [Aulosira sp. ZfuVER01]MDZ8002519.1 hypothetical protein [Aulosira sp. DedVER01a]MDZ8050803.1 hypothetical protein [Aulosira sp. ZfuCHP01]
MTAENKRLEKLIGRLHSRSLPEDVSHQIIKLGKPAYNYLFQKIDEPTLTECQVINIIRVLYAMRCHGDIQIFINKLLLLTKNERISVRSVASHLSICLVLMAEAFEELNIPLQREMLKPLLQNAFVMGLNPGVAEFTKHFLSNTN